MGCWRFYEILYDFFIKLYRATDKYYYYYRYHVFIFKKMQRLLSNGWKEERKPAQPASCDLLLSVLLHSKGSPSLSLRSILSLSHTQNPHPPPFLYITLNPGLLAIIGFVLFLHFENAKRVLKKWWVWRNLLEKSLLLLTQTLWSWNWIDCRTKSKVSLSLSMEPGPYNAPSALHGIVLTRAIHLHNQWFRLA